jgi:plasmid stabilization system protein ParE
MKYEFHPNAFAEFEAAADYYAERQPGLELRFIDAVDAAIRKAVESPGRWRIFDGEIRRVLVHVFPYAVLYSIEPDRIYIISVMHSSRKPGYWKDRIS